MHNKSGDTAKLGGGKRRIKVIGDHHGSVAKKKLKKHAHKSI
jgi:hypothetical protein